MEKELLSLLQYVLFPEQAFSWFADLCEILNPAIEDRYGTARL